MKDLLELVKMSQENGVDLEIITGEEEQKPVTSKEATEALSKRKASHEELFDDFDDDFNSNMPTRSEEVATEDNQAARDDILKRIKEIKERINKSSESTGSKEDLERAMELCRRNGVSVGNKKSKKGKRSKSDKRLIKSRQLEERIKLGIAGAAERRMFLLKNLPWLEKGVMEDLEALGYSTIGNILDSSATQLAEKIGGKDANGNFVAADPEILAHMVNKIQDAMRRIGIYFRKNCYKDRDYSYRRKNKE